MDPAGRPREGLGGRCHLCALGGLPWAVDCARGAQSGVVGPNAPASPGASDRVTAAPISDHANHRGVMDDGGGIPEAGASGRWKGGHGTPGGRCPCNAGRWEHLGGGEGRGGNWDRGQQNGPSRHCLLRNLGSGPTCPTCSGRFAGYRRSECTAHPRRPGHEGPACPTGSVRHHLCRPAYPESTSETE